MELSPVVNELIKVFEEPPSPKQGTGYNVSQTVSLLAVLYEKARNAVEFRAEHLVRKAAIERILKRRIIINGGSSTIAENLVLELLWARYIDSSLIDEDKIKLLQSVIDRYLTLKGLLSSEINHKNGISWDCLLGLMSSEIEEILVSSKKREALVNFFYQSVRPKIRIAAVQENRLNILTFLAVQRAYAQADDALISFQLIKMLQPDWISTKADGVSQIYDSFISSLSVIRNSLKDPLSESLYRYVRRQVPPFLLIRDLLSESGTTIGSLINDPSSLETKLGEIASRRYLEIGAKVRRAVVRSFIYIFLTKMLFALALEAPYDIYIARKITYLPLAINTLFPPILLFLVAGLFSVPGSDNTIRLTDRIKKIFYDFEGYQKETNIYVPASQTRRPILMTVFSFIYLATFVVSFGAINYILSFLHFSLASKTIFFFFIALVSFFAYRIRQSAKEYEITERQGILEPMIDFFFLPILRAGHLLSREIARLNVFIFFFDFILEAPLKVIFEVAEEWIRFVRTKKEEII